MKYSMVTWTIILISIISIGAQAQKTGSFDETIQFMGEDRTLSFYVPTNYDPEIQYDLIVGLHGLGDNSVNFRNALGPAFINFLPNTICVFPDGGNDQARDFLSPEGDEEIIAEAIKFASENYSIDTSRIILEGFSLGGRSALIYGLENPDKFLGLMLHTPAIQGIDDAGNPAIKYENSNKIPIVVIYGMDDYFYAYFVPYMYKLLLDHNAMARIAAIPDFGHSVPLNQTFVQGIVNFFEEKYTDMYNVELFDILNENKTCQGNIPLKTSFRSIGSEEISSITFNYSVNGESNEYTWDGNLKPYEYIEVDLTDIVLSEGSNIVELSVSKLNGDYSPDTAWDDTISTNIAYYPQGMQLPYTQGFEQGFPIEGWSFINSGDSKDWDLAGPGYGSDASVLTMNIGIFNNLGLESGLTSPVFDLSTLSEPAIYFDYAYMYFRISGVAGYNIYSDTLEISISTDCGENWNSIYRKAGEELAVIEPVTDPASINQMFYVPASDDEWARETIDLSDFGDETNVILKFNSISNGGGVIYIDNVTVDNLNSVKDNIFAHNINISPNPADALAEISFNLEEYTNIDIRLADLNGVIIQDVHRGGLLAGFNRFTIDTSPLSAGMYFIVLERGSNKITRKLIVK
ncbi:MAG: T9SS type A sorting domain-containing protein [Candidatus Kapaibacterium sp.]